MSEILFYSTNRKAKQQKIKEAILKGLAEDGGLYFPSVMPTFSPQEIASFQVKEYWQVAQDVFRKFLSGTMPDEEIARICKDSYNFGIPLQRLEKKKYIMWLDEGPTLAFKDFAARAMARIMQYFLKADNKKALILTATSGDTGSAVANAFYGMENIKIVVLYPKNEVTERQRKLMTTLGGNVTALEIDGKFDDCQALVKMAFMDEKLKKLNLGSANSINFARLMPQIVYYIYAVSRLGRATFSVPSGNFGNVVAGLIAKRMGADISKFIIAVNSNDSFARFYRTSKYSKILPSINCISNAMNIGYPSNLPRLFELYDGQMSDNGTIVKMPDLAKLKKDIWAISVSDEQTMQEIKFIRDKYGVIIEPHGAVGLFAYERYLEQEKDNVIGICLETADPAKFHEQVARAIGVEPLLPKSIKEALKKKEEFKVLGKEYGEFKEYLLETEDVS